MKQTEQDLTIVPSGACGQASDLRIRRLLAESLAHLSEACTEHLSTADRNALSHAADSLGQGTRLHPLVFGHYAEWVHAALKDDTAQIHAAVAALLGAAAAGDDYPRLTQLDAAELQAGRPLITALMTSDSDDGFALLPPDPAGVAQAQRTLTQAWSLATERLPELAAEMRAVLAQTILVGNAPDSALQFDGGSTYMLWGALMVNGDMPRSPVVMLELLAHETAHLLLYAAAHAEPLVKNAESERYPSPLRQDLRPMDGIYHATWVSARMAWTMHQLAAHAATPENQRAEARAAFSSDIANFRAGHSVVQAHAHLTPTGAAVMASAESWIAAITG